MSSSLTISRQNRHHNQVPLTFRLCAFVQLTNRFDDDSHGNDNKERYHNEQTAKMPTHSRTHSHEHTLNYARTLPPNNNEERIAKRWNASPKRAFSERQPRTTPFENEQQKRAQDRNDTPERIDRKIISWKQKHTIKDFFSSSIRLIFIFLGAKFALSKSGHKLWLYEMRRWVAVWR